jgi:hypothetical protein
MKMLNRHPHVFTPEERGHRKRVDPDENTSIYALRIPGWWKKPLKKIGAEKVRDSLGLMIVKEDDENEQAR